MHKALDQLSEDHANFSALLSIVEREIDIAASGERPVDEILTAAMSYFRSYPAQFHHPKEDLIYGHLMERFPKLATGIYDMVEDHKNFDERVGLFEKALNCSNMDDGSPQREFCITARLFVADERKHIEFEEHSFFPLVRESLAIDDWTGCIKELATLEDPLFGKSVAVNFHQMRQKIIALLA